MSTRESRRSEPSTGARAWRAARADCSDRDALPCSRSLRSRSLLLLDRDRSRLPGKLLTADLSRASGRMARAASGFRRDPGSRRAHACGWAPKPRTGSRPFRRTSRRVSRATAPAERRSSGRSRNLGMRAAERLPVAGPRAESPPEPYRGCLGSRRDAQEIRNPARVFRCLLSRCPRARSQLECSCADRQRPFACPRD